ncbi:uncharacterized protein YpuA (DUF1002 family) [Weissella uvarum]|uniref:DUF1002 domain-containing protein n=1 Tax=Weissella uvarum TaxID=1479233 RepID=UPI001961D03F|nr:DUF1002 domain-containing protein [Weissella uvarum]MBM7617667.1 uncharacterized protein YpuA (DUF1002 family) [Weissella uvarum]MCM0596016.1 DUF1002 domain-containing protein [Weissella uvarum]
MKWMQKLLGVTVVTVIMSLLPLTVVGHAEDNHTQKPATQGQVRALSKPYVVYGSGAVQRTQIAQTLGINKNYEKLVINGKDARYIGINQVNDSDMISSVAVAPAEPGTGVLVNIEKFEGQNNIQRVSAQEYAMAATMAGLKDVIITVTSEKPVSGDSALAGVYKALQTDGMPMDPRNVNAANHLMDVTNGIIMPDDKSSHRLTAAVTDTASELASQKQKHAKIDDSRVDNQLVVNLKQRRVANDVNGDQMAQLKEALKAVNAAPISDSKAFVKQSAQLANKINASSGNTMADADDFKNSQDAHNASNWFVENIVHPVQRFFTAIKDRLN